MISEAENQPFLNYSDNERATKKPIRSSQPVLGDESGPKKPGGLSTRVVSHALVFVFTSLLWILLSLFINPSSVTQHRTAGQIADPKLHNFTSNAYLVTCGNSIQEAKRMGCKYDVLLNNWIPTQCVDKESTDEYEKAGTWNGFTDENRTQQISSIEAMSEMDFYYTSTKDRLNHCSMLWKKQFHVLFEERPSIDAIIASWAQTEHCSQFLTEIGDKIATVWDDPIKTEVGWAGCWVRY